MNIRALIIEVLSQSPLMHLATSANNKPWASAVYFAFDEDFSLYFVSRNNRRHSEEIQSNALVAATITIAPTAPFENPNRGVQVEGICKQADDKDLADIILKLYQQRFPASQKHYPNVEAVTGESLPRFYKISPTRIVLFDEENFPKAPQQVLEL